MSILIVEILGVGVLSEKIQLRNIILLYLRALSQENYIQICRLEIRKNNRLLKRII